MTEKDEMQQFELTFVYVCDEVQAGIHAVFEGDLPRKQGIFLAQRRTKANILVLAHAKFQPYVTSGADAVLKHTHRRRHRNMANKAVYSILSIDNSDG